MVRPLAHDTLALEPCSNLVTYHSGLGSEGALTRDFLTRHARSWRRREFGY